MRVNWYDEVELKDGRCGCVIEIFDAPNGDEKERGYLIELSPSPNNSETVTVQIGDIRKVIS